jgi:hypothetical protein
MPGLALSLSLLVAAFCAALTLCHRAGLRTSRRQAELLRPALAAAIRNSGSAELLELCGRYPRCALARIAKEAVLRTQRVGGSAASRSEILRIVLNQACVREQHLLNRVSRRLRAVAFLSAAIGMMVAASNTADALGFISFCVPVESWKGGELSEVVATLIAGLSLSLFVFLLYTYIEACTRSELARLQEDSSSLLCDLLSASSAYSLLPILNLRSTSGT